MRSVLAERAPVDARTVKRTLLVVWQDPLNRRFQTVGQLDYLDDGEYVFKYLEGARSERFFPLDEYPDLDHVYESSTLPVFFANRVMSSERPAYSQYLSWLGLEGMAGSDVPVEVLARTGGGRATDTFHLVDSPTMGDGRFESRFFVSGLRYVTDGIARAGELSEGEELELVPEPNNPINPRAMLVTNKSRAQIGWVPDWLCHEVSRLADAGWRLHATAEKINSEAPVHTRVLCAIVATRV